MKKNEIIEKLRSEKKYLSDNFFVENIGLFGSYSKNTFNENSDIDLIVSFNKPVGFKFMELAEYLENLFGRKIDLLTPDGLSSIRNSEIKNTISQEVEYV